MGREWEIKLLARPDLDVEGLCRLVREEGFELTPTGEGQQVDTYLDSSRLDLRRSGVGLRVREKGEHRHLTFKTEGARHGAVFDRLEIDGPWSREGIPRAARALPEPIRREVEPRTYARSLKELARIETWRRAFDLRHLASGARAELAIDSVRARAGHGREGSFGEIEIEALEGGTEAWPPLAQRLVDAFSCEPSKVNKLARALEIGQVAPPTPRRRLRIRDEMPYEQAAFEVFRKHFARLQANEPGTRLAEDIEALHDMRVSSRRLRAAFRLLSGAFPPGALDQPAALMRETGQTLGVARDLDVFLDGFEDLRATLPEAMAGDLEPFEALIVEERQREQRRVLKWMQSPRRLRAFELFEEFLEQGPGRTNPYGIRTGQIAPSLILGLARKVYRKGGRIKRSSPADKLHALRILMKKLRYAMEDFSELYGDDLECFITDCKRLQDVLGAFNDARVMTQWLGEFVQHRGARLPKSSLLAIGCLIGALHVKGDDARRRFRKAWKRFDRESVRDELNQALVDVL